MSGPTARSRRHAEAGQTSAEYVGILAVVAAVVAALAASGVGATLATSLGCAVRSIVTQSGSCGSTVPPVTFPAGDGTGSAGGSKNPGESKNPAGSANPVDQAEVDDALGTIRDDLDGGWNGVRSDELTDIEKVLDDLSGPELDAVLAGLTDDELRRWIDELDDGRLGSGWSRERRQQLWSMIASKASPNTMQRLARLTDEVQPDFRDVGGDDARDDPNNPINQAGYGNVPHELFVAQDGEPPVSPTDLEQGYLGDCWFIASLGAIANRNPGLIEKMIQANDNGTYTVTFYDDGKPVRITVTPDLPTVNGDPVFVDNPRPSDAGDGVHELWPQIIEKAAAQYYGDYTDLEGDWPAKALELVTGTEVTTYDSGWLPWSEPDPPSVNDLADTLTNGGAVLVSTDNKNRNQLYKDNVLVQRHAYYVQSVDPKAGTVTVVNPWGLQGNPPITMTYQQFRDSFIRYDVADLKGT